MMSCDAIYDILGNDILTILSPYRDKFDATGATVTILMDDQEQYGVIDYYFSECEKTVFGVFDEISKKIMDVIPHEINVRFTKGHKQDIWVDMNVVFSKHIGTKKIEPMRGQSIYIEKIQ